MLTPAGLTNILENYAQIVEEKDPRTGKKKRKQVWPRYHQLGVVRQALADVRAHGAGKRYLIQHSAGSGKSNSIAWLAHQLIGVKRNDKEVFDSVIVVTDRRLLDDQIQTTIKQFMQVGATVGHAEHSGDLRKFIEEGRRSSSRRCRSSPSSSTRSRPRAARPSPSSSTRRTPARAARPRRR